MKKLIIFDMDGLLLDTERLYQKCWIKVINEKGLDITQSELRLLIGNSFDETKKFFTGRLGSEEAFYELRQSREEAFWKEVELYGLPTKEGATEILAYLTQKNIMTALITSTEETRAKKLLALARVEHKFDYMVFSNMVTNTKPDPEVYHFLERQTSIPKSEWLVLEDSYNGLKAANNADVDVIWIKDLVELKDHSVNYVATFNSLLEVIDII